uniref:Uncharacterized protein n=1 Tax=Anguilla anguilla TaxID=7936 RepID=A0A0E9TG12_ANGAN
MGCLLQSSLNKCYFYALVHQILYMEQKYILIIYLLKICPPKNEHFYSLLFSRAPTFCSQRTHAQHKPASWCFTA